MSFFEKKPLRRLLFVLVYILCFIWFLNKNFFGVNIIVFFVMLLGIYISLVKSTVIRDKNADRISNFRFDTLTVLLSVILLIDIIASL